MNRTTPRCDSSFLFPLSLSLQSSLSVSLFPLMCDYCIQTRQMRHHSSTFHVKGYGVCRFPLLCFFPFFFVRSTLAYHCFLRGRKSAFPSAAVYKRGAFFSRGTGADLFVVLEISTRSSGETNTRPLCFGASYQKSVELTMSAQARQQP